MKQINKYTPLLFFFFSFISTLNIQASHSEKSTAKGLFSSLFSYFFQKETTVKKDDPFEFEEIYYEELHSINDGQEEDLSDDNDLYSSDDEITMDFEDIDYGELCGINDVKDEDLSDDNDLYSSDDDNDFYSSDEGFTIINRSHYFSAGKCAMIG